MNEILLIGGMALVTFAVRYPVLVLMGRIPLPERVFRALRYVPPAVLTAIIMPELLLPGGAGLTIGPDNEHLIAGAAAGLVAWRSKRLLPTLIVGMGVFYLWRLLLSVR